MKKIRVILFFVANSFLTGFVFSQGASVPDNIISVSMEKTIFNLNIDDSLFIKKENVHATNPFLIPVVVTPKIKQYGKNYYYKHRFLSEYDMMYMLKEKHDSQIDLHLRKLKFSNVIRCVSTFGVPLVLIGSGYFLSSHFSTNERSLSQNTRQNIGGVLIGLSAVCLGTTIYFSVKEKEHCRKAIELFNKRY